MNNFNWKGAGYYEYRAEKAKKLTNIWLVIQCLFFLILFICFCFFISDVLFGCLLGASGHFVFTLFVMVDIKKELGKIIGEKNE